MGYNCITDLKGTYTNFNLLVKTGKQYKIKATVPSEYAGTAGMIIIPYTQNLLNAYNNHTSINTSLNTNASAGWQGLEQTITIPYTKWNGPCIGILLSFRQNSSNTPISDSFAINSVHIEEVTPDINLVRYDTSQNKSSEEKKQARDNIDASENFYVTPQMFGAKGDGVTDDTAAFQAAINSGHYVYVPLNNGQRYVITDTLVISIHRQAIYGDLTVQDYASFIKTQWNGCIFFNKQNSVLFDFKSGAQGCSNLSIETPANSNNTAIRMAKNSDVTNVDSSVYNCYFTGFNVAIDHYGRGLNVKGNLFLECDTAIKTTIANEPRWDHQNPTISELTQTYPEYNGRGLVVTNNRFHVIRNRYLLVISEDYSSGSITKKQVLNGAIVTNNMGDWGDASFEFRAPIKGCVFSNNMFLRTVQDVFFDCTEGASNCTIADNTIRGLIDNNYPYISAYGKDCFAFNGLEYSSISGNVIENFKQRCVYCYGEGMKNSAVIGNIFKNYGIDTTANQYERAGFDVPNCENSVISNNTFETVSDFDGYMIRARDVNSNVWKRNVFNDNTCTKRNSAEVLVPTTAETEDNIIQGIS